MPRGRPPQPNVEEFAQLIWANRALLGGTPAAIEEKTRVNRGTIDAFFDRRRPGFGLKDRIRLLEALGIHGDKAIRERYLRFPDGLSRDRELKELILLDPVVSPHIELDEGQRLLICGTFPEALRALLKVLNHAHKSGDQILEADAAARIAWTYYEVGQYQDSLRFVSHGVRLIERHTGAPIQEILQSITPHSFSAICTTREEASEVLSRVLQIRYKVLIEQVLYYDDVSLHGEAEKAVAMSVALDRHLQLPAALGHDLRWQAVLGSWYGRPQIKSSETWLGMSQDLFSSSSLGHAYLTRDRGIVQWQNEKFASSESLLVAATEALCAFADIRAMGPAFHVLSRLSESACDARAARRYSLIGAALHPYGFVLKNARRHLRNSKADPQKEFENLRAGKGPFEIIERAFEQLPNGPFATPQDRLEVNLMRIVRVRNEDTHSGLANPYKA